MTDMLAVADGYGSRVAIIGSEGSFTYADLATAARTSAAAIRHEVSSMIGARVALMVPPGLRYVASQWGTWAAGGTSVPLAVSNPAAEIAHVLDDAGVSAVVASTEYRALLRPLLERRAVPLLDADDVAFGESARDSAGDPDHTGSALILYTSGTTGPPKGVVWTHDALRVQLEILSAAWGWQRDDRALLALPLHHVHGLINVTGCALWNGAILEMLPSFDAEAVWERFLSGELTVFMAVPTIYRRLIAVWDEADEAFRSRARAALEGMRLMVSGSAALPVPTLERWEEISGHLLLERYGMTEIGMALSNPYHGERTPGAVGAPLPTVDARVVGEEGTPLAAGTPGELEVRGPSVFREYWRRPDATAAAFHDGWFRTGDEVVFDGGVFRILGRQSVDIIKSGGEKVSALEVEDVLRRHPAVSECAVVGIEDEEWGERVCIAVVAEGEAPDLDDLRNFARVNLAPHKLPRDLVVIDELPRNALGKVIKPKVKELFGI